MLQQGWGCGGLFLGSGRPDGDLLLGRFVNVLNEQRGLPGQGRLPRHVGLRLVTFCLLEGGRVGLAVGTPWCPCPFPCPGDPVGTLRCPFSSHSRPVAPCTGRRGWGPGGRRLIVVAVQKLSSVALARRHRVVSSLANVLWLGLSGSRRSAGGSQCWVPEPGSLGVGREEPLPPPRPLLGLPAT